MVSVKTPVGVSPKARGRAFFAGRPCIRRRRRPTATMLLRHRSTRGGKAFLPAGDETVDSLAPPSRPASSTSPLGPPTSRSIVASCQSTPASRSTAAPLDHRTKVFRDAMTLRRPGTSDLPAKKAPTTFARPRRSFLYDRITLRLLLERAAVDKDRREAIVYEIDRIGRSYILRSRRRIAADADRLPSMLPTSSERATSRPTCRRHRPYD